MAGAGGTGLGGKVYMGVTYGQYGPHGGSGSTAPQKKGTDVWLSANEASQDFYNWNTKKQSDVVAQGILSGMLTLGDGHLEGATLCKKLVNEAANHGAIAKNVSPRDL